jgi:protein-tyrosine-phosphatase
MLCCITEHELKSKKKKADSAAFLTKVELTMSELMSEGVREHGLEMSLHVSAFS